MKTPRFRLLSLMALVFFVALALAGWHEVERLDQARRKRLGEGSLLVLPVLAFVLAKLGLILWMKAMRGAPRATPPDEQSLP